MELINLNEDEKEFYSVIISYIGLLTIYTGFALLSPLIFLIAFPDEFNLVYCFLLPSVSAISLGYILWKKFKINNSPTFDLRHSTIIVTFGWLLAVFFGSLPFFLANELTLVDSVFEAFSGWTTTGLTMVVNEDVFPNLLLFWRSLMQFIGGAGLAIMMLTAIVCSTDIRSGMYISEAREKKLLPSITSTAKLIAKIYISYMFIGSILYILAGMNWFEAINHSMCAFATGGFSTRSESIGAFPLIIQALTIVFMFLGNINFALHYKILKGDLKELFLDVEPRLFFKLILVSVPIVFFGLFSLRNNELAFSIFNSIFQSVSALTGTGYMTVEANSLYLWGGLPIFILVILMITGASTGSTGGGLKQLRVAIILKSIFWEIKKRMLPSRAVIDTSIRHIGEKITIKKENMWSVTTFTSIFISYYLIGVLFFLGYDYSISESLFEMASALGTVGLTVGVTGPEMPIILKVVQIMGMWLGRLEFWTIFTGFLSVFRDFKR